MGEYTMKFENEYKNVLTELHDLKENAVQLRLRAVEDTVQIFQRIPGYGSVLVGRLTSPNLPTDVTVSIHAPARGATRYTTSNAHNPMFQSTPPRGGRPPDV